MMSHTNILSQKHAVGLHCELQFILLILMQNTREFPFCSIIWILSVQKETAYRAVIHVMFLLLTFHILTVQFSNKLKQNCKTLETT